MKKNAWLYRLFCTYKCKNNLHKISNDYGIVENEQIKRLRYYTIQKLLQVIFLSTVRKWLYPSNYINCLKNGQKLLHVHVQAIFLSIIRNWNLSIQTPKIYSSLKLTNFIQFSKLSILFKQLKKFLSQRTKPFSKLHRYGVNKRGKKKIA